MEDVGKEEPVMDNSPRVNGDTVVDDFLGSDFSGRKEGTIEGNEILTNGGSEGEVPIDQVTGSSDPVQIPPTLNPFDNTESILTPKATSEYYIATSPKTPTVEDRHLTSPSHVTPPTSEQPTSPFHMTSPPRVTSPGMVSPPPVTPPSHVTPPRATLSPSVTTPPFVTTSPSVTSPTQSDPNPFSDDLEPSLASNNPFDPGFQAETSVSPEPTTLAETNPFLQDILRGMGATNAREQHVVTRRDRSHHFSRDLDDEELLVTEGGEGGSEEEEEREFLSPLKYEVTYGAPEVHEDHFTPELSLREINHDIAKLKTLIVRNTDNQKLKKSLIEQQLQRQKIMEVRSNRADAFLVL